VLHGVEEQRMSATEQLTIGRNAFTARAWARAYEALSAADEDGELGADDLDRLALAAYLTGHDDACDRTLERSVRLLADDDRRRAARAAFWLALGLFRRGEPARAGGWLSRAHRLLADDGDRPCAEQGLLLIPAGLQALFSGDGEAAVGVFGQAVDVGRRFRDPDVSAFGVLGSGQAMVAIGRREAGLALLDEAMVAVTAEDVSPVTVGIVYCAVIETCHLAFDLHRAREWTGELTRWCAAQPDLVPYRGQCLVHRAQVLALEGQWSAAMEEMTRARERLADPPGQPAFGLAWYQTGELLRGLGRHALRTLARLSSRHSRRCMPAASAGTCWLPPARSAAPAATPRRLARPRTSWTTSPASRPESGSGRSPRRRSAACCWPRAARGTPERSCAEPSRHGGSCTCPTRPRACGSSSARCVTLSATPTARCSSGMQPA
jgi:tetratricopeptide (TPR) repeat protein